MSSYLLASAVAALASANFLASNSALVGTLGSAVAALLSSTFLSSDVVLTDLGYFAGVVLTTVVVGLF